MHRRHLILSAPLALGLGVILPRPAAGFILPETDTISFSVFRRNDSPMGYHRLRFKRDGDRLIMEKEISLEVTLAFVTAYRYRHRNREVWEAVSGSVRDGA